MAICRKKINGRSDRFCVWTTSDPSEEAASQ